MREAEFKQLLRECNAPVHEWHIPPKMLWRSVKRRETKLFLEQDGLHSLVKSLWAVVSYLALDGTLYYLYEMERIFANGVSNYRPRFVMLPGASELQPVAFSESSGENEDEKRLILRAFWEEMRRRIAWNRIMYEYLRRLETHDSVACKGTKTSTWGPVVSLVATSQEFASGSEIIAVDERKIMTRLGWETAAQMRIRRAKALKEKPPEP